LGSNYSSNTHVVATGNALHQFPDGIVHEFRTHNVFVTVVLLTPKVKAFSVSRKLVGKLSKKQKTTTSQWTIAKQHGCNDKPARKHVTYIEVSGIHLNLVVQVKTRHNVVKRMTKDVNGLGDQRPVVLNMQLLQSMLAGFDCTSTFEAANHEGANRLERLAVAAAKATRAERLAVSLGEQSVWNVRMPIWNELRIQAMGQRMQCELQPTTQVTQKSVDFIRQRHVPRGTVRSLQSCPESLAH
jgi:desulfoferrodoxin (superoxide reductase-like protein)